MRAELIEYTPDGKQPSELSIEEFNATAKALRSAGILRMHAMGRLLDELCEAAEKKGYEWQNDESGFTEKFIEKAAT